MSFGTLSIEFAPPPALALAGGGRNPGGDPSGARPSGAGRGASLWRLIACAALLAALANPSAVREDRKYLNDVAVVVVDDFREPERAAAPRADRRRSGRGREAHQGDPPGWSFRVIHAGNEPSSESVDGGGTRLFTALAKAISDLPASRIAGAVFISDGQIHDIPADLDFPRLPRAGAYAAERPARRSRPAPRHGSIPQLRHRRQGRGIQAPGRGPARPAPGTLARINIMKDGKPLPPVQVAIGEDVPFNFDIDHGGQKHLRISRSSRGPRS